MSWDIGGPVSKSWWSDDKQLISSKCTITQQAMFTAFHPMSNMQKIHQPTHIFTMPLPPLKINFFEVKICEADPQECTWQQTPTLHKVSCSLEEQKLCRGWPGSVCMSLCDHRARRQRLGHPAQDTWVLATLLNSAEVSWSGKPRAKHTGEWKKKKKHKQKYREFLPWMPHRKKTNSNKARTMQEQVWPVLWDAPTFTIRYLTVLLLLLLMCGSCRKQLTLTCWLHADSAIHLPLYCCTSMQRSCSACPE